MIEDKLLDELPRESGRLSSVPAARLLSKRADRIANNKKNRGGRKRQSAKTDAQEFITNTCARKVQNVSPKRHARQHQLQQLLQDEYVLYNDRCLAGFCKSSILEVPAPIGPPVDDDTYDSFVCILEGFQISTRKVHYSVACEKDNDLADAYDDNIADHGWLHCSDRDLRATSKGKLRDRKQKEKYYRYRASKPLMIGKSCYTLTLTKPEKRSGEGTMSTKRRLKQRHPLVVRENEDRVALKKLSNKASYLVSLNVPALVVMAASSADKVRRQSGTPVPTDGALLPSNPLDLVLEEFHKRAPEMRIWDSNCYIVSCENLDARLRLKVRTWTKRDSYENRTNFHNSYYIAQRHRSRKLTYDGKRHKKITLRRLGRDTKSNSGAIGRYRTSSGQWHTIDDDVRFDCCFACECIENFGHEFEIKGVEEYLWEWDEAERWAWQDEYWWRTGIDLGPWVEDHIEPDQPAEQLYGTDFEDQFSIGQPQIIQENVNEPGTAPPESPMSDWVLHLMSDADSDFDLMSESGGTISDCDWEELAVQAT